MSGGTVQHPFQRILVKRTESDELLLACCGAKLCTISLRDGSLQDVWSKSDRADLSEVKESNGDNRPAANNSRGDAIVDIILSHDQRHVILTTGEQKMVHVLTISDDGKLKHMSERWMTKRPCSLAITSDGSILVGDKFGDVYLLPLHFDASTVKTVHTPTTTTFKPAATSLTVHSGRNLQSLRDQERQAQQSLITPKQSEKDEPGHELLLGHVSMLTDIVVATSTQNERTRQYIITADRDEHIRISRGPPQSHIIEAYCHGHTSFVSKLVPLPGDLLVSVGGDGQVIIWNWLYGSLLKKLDISQALKQAGSVVPEQFAVSSLLVVLVQETIHIFCAIEARVVVVKFIVDLAQVDAHTQQSEVLILPGNVLDLQSIELSSHAKVLASLDVAHEPNTTIPSTDGTIPRMCFVDGEAISIAEHEAYSISQDHAGNIKDVLYNVGKLRKWTNDED